MYGHHQHLNCSNKTFGCFFLHTVVTLVPSCASQECSQENEHNKPDFYNILRYRQVPWTNCFTIRKALVYLIVVFWREEKSLIILTFMGCFLDSLATKDVPTRRFALYNHRKRDRYVIISPSCDMPLIGISKVFQNKLRDIDFAFCFCLRSH